MLYQYVVWRGWMQILRWSVCRMCLQILQGQCEACLRDWPLDREGCYWCGSVGLRLNIAVIVMELVFCDFLDQTLIDSSSGLYFFERFIKKHASCMHGLDPDLNCKCTDYCNTTFGISFATVLGIHLHVLIIWKWIHISKTKFILLSWWYWTSQPFTPTYYIKFRILVHKCLYQEVRLRLRLKVLSLPKKRFGGASLPKQFLRIRSASHPRENACSSES